MRLIAKKDSANPTHPNLGFIRPLYRLNEGRWQTVTHAQFPNPGKVFVTAEYNEIDDKYLSDELFFADFQVNTQSYTTSNPFSCQYVSSYAQTRQPEPHELCPIFPRTFDATQLPLLHTAYETPLTYVFLQMGTDTVGPFQAIYERDLSDDRKEFRLAAVPAAELEQPTAYDGCVYRFRRADYVGLVLSVDNHEYIRDVRELLESSAPRETIYVGDTDDLLRWAKQVVRPAERREFWERAEQVLTAVPRSTDPLERQKLAQLRELLTQGQRWFNERLPEFIGQFLTDHPLGQQALDEYLKANEGRLFRVPEKNTTVVSKASPTGAVPGDTVESYLTFVGDYMAECGRPLDRTDLTHYLVTLHQNFLTVLAGLPGVGKTSLLTLLARASGLHDRFLPISVARGWVSSRDLIGYHNPLTGQFQPARTGMFDVLRQCSDEVEQGHERPYWVLLDEANLSPMEHYWSDFVGLSDPETARVLRLSEQTQTLTLGHGIRFVATINYDHTTEPLSPRLIDRAAIIRLKPLAGADLAIGRDSLPPLPTITPQMPFMTETRRNEWFGTTDETRHLLSDEANLLLQLRQVLDDERVDWGMPLLLSPRKQKAIVNHTATLRRLLGEEIAYPLLALDYAVGLHLLPLLSGRGEGFGKRLAELHDRTIRTLPLSAQTLHRLIRLGQQQYHQYNFFV
ncbi:MAG: hypothetical protein EAZ91_02840 [Cytophagales bacterium]|nr:MAG: hypothetical protein EAZ91_02840 [Cytophagales bacterium]